ncbi:MAG TPA: hypothetical protein VEU62_02845 [Bryobacterales bacterium]|nr:hypothetical protein [Bryobacterales bacterium]
MAVADGKHKFPCPVCMEPRQVRLTKKDKPYVVCDPCGVQLFVRGPGGVEAFSRLVDTMEAENLLSRFEEMEARYRLKCPKCKTRFWAEPRLIQTNLFDGSFKGFRCPQKGCGATVPWEQKQ